MYSITTLDGRYKKDVEELRDYFSEYALMETRYYLEITYLEFISEILKGDRYKINQEFNKDAFKQIKSIERTTNHDVKAVEYYIKTLIPDYDKEYRELVHFGLTSHDINNISNIVNIRNSIDNIFQPIFSKLNSQISKISKDYMFQPMLSRTHGQPATPTTLGKEFSVYSFRLGKQLNQLDTFIYSCKLGGAVGLMNAHYIVDHKIDWQHKLSDFANKLGLLRDPYTTQLNSYDNLSELLGIVQRISTILIDFCQDVWLYISMDYFKLKIVKGEVGSSTMPHKVNPIFFENAEGNLGLANALIQHFQIKLPISRLQRDLTDSTVIRNVGSIFGYILKAVRSIIKGINRLDVNVNKISDDLNNNWAVVTEGIQTILRYEGYADAYDKLKEFSRGSQVTRDSLQKFINALDVSEEVKNRLKDITPENYLGFLS